MSLAWTSLDDRQFQPLVDEMRKQIVRYCPEWTDYNISDPGITLIELFAWLTDLTLYRLNQVPIKNYVAFLDLLGVQPAPAASAQVELTFRLSAPFADPSAPLNTLIERHFPVSTRDLPGVDAPFTTVEALKIVTPTIKQIYAGLQDPLPVTRPLEGFKSRPFYAFAANPGHGDEETENLIEGACFCIGLEAVVPLSGTLAGHIVQLTFHSDPTKAKGQSNNDPPLVWECWVKEGQRAEWRPFDMDQIELEQGIRHIFSQEQATMIFYLPQNLHWDDPVINGVYAYWLRCCFRRTAQSQKPYTTSPRILAMGAAVLGASVLARHASFVHEEVLGQSDGAAGQSFTLQHPPVLALDAGETIEVEESVATGAPYATKEYHPWQRVATFAHSSRHDRHYCLDESSGEVTFGPGIVQPDGAVRQYGRIPEPGSRIRITRYRHGGGTVGNVPANQITVMHKSVPYIDQVTNRRKAKDGRDLEGLEQTVMRARAELFGPHRAVTAQDFETLALRMVDESSYDRVARAKCITPAALPQRLQGAPATQAAAVDHQGGTSSLWPGAIQVLVTPDVADAVATYHFAALALKPEFCNAVSKHLDNYRLLTTHVEIARPRYVAVQVKTTIVRTPQVTDAEIKTRVDEALRRYIAPLALPKERGYGADLLPAGWIGWPFGQHLYVAELFAFIQKVPGVKHVLQVAMNQSSFDPAAIASDPDLAELQRSLTPVAVNQLELAEDTLPCSLAHSVEVVAL